MKKIFSSILAILIGFTLIACAKTKPEKPVFSGIKEEVELKLNDSFNPLKDVKASTKQEKNIKIEVYGWNDEYAKKNGSYQVVYYAKTKANDEAYATTTVYVGDKNNYKKTFFLGMGQDQLKELVTAKYNNNEINKNDIKIENEPAKEDENYKLGMHGIVFKVECDGKIATKTTLLNIKKDEIPELDKAQKINLSLWHAMGGVNLEVIEKFAKEFNNKYPNITIEVPLKATGGKYEELKDNVVKAIQASVYPNIVQSTSDHVMEYLNSNKAINLDQYIYHPTYGLNGDDSLKDILPAFLNENRSYDYEKTFYSLPFNKSTEVVLYNKDVFERLKLEMPATWQDLMLIAPKLKEEGERIQKQKIMEKHNITTDAQITPAIFDEITTAQKLVMPIVYDDDPNMFITFARQWGGKYTKIKEDGSGEILFSEDENVKAAMKFLNENKQYLNIPKYAEQRFGTPLYQKQQTFVLIGSSAGVWYNMDKNNEFKTNTAPIFYNKEKPEHRAVLQRGTNITILDSGDPQKNLASWLFLKYIISKEKTLENGMKTGYIPVRKSAHNSKKYQDLIKIPFDAQNPGALAAKASTIQANYYFFNPAFSGSSLLRNLVGQVVERIITGDGNIEEALKSAYDSAKTLTGIK